MPNAVTQSLKRPVRLFVYWLYHGILAKLLRIYQKEFNNRIYLCAAPPIVRLVELNNTRFAIYVGSHGYIEDTILRDGNWSGDLLLLSDYFITPDSAIIDVGANIGFESLYFAKRFRDSIVYSYEPGTYAHASLLLSKSYNHLTNLKVFKLAAGDTIGNSEMASPSPVSFNKGLGSLNQNLDIERTYKPERVDVVTLDSHYCEKRRVSLVKIDTQGFELNVLRGATNTINEHRPVVIFEHEDQYHSDAKEVRESIGDFFERAEYDLYAPGRHFLTRLAFCGVPHLHGDVIALPRK